MSSWMFFTSLSITYNVISHLSFEMKFLLASQTYFFFLNAQLLGRKSFLGQNNASRELRARGLFWPWLLLAYCVIASFWNGLLTSKPNPLWLKVIISQFTKLYLPSWIVQFSNTVTDPVYNSWKFFRCCDNKIVPLAWFSTLVNSYNCAESISCWDDTAQELSMGVKLLK